MRKHYAEQFRLAGMPAEPFNLEQETTTKGTEPTPKPVQSYLLIVPPCPKPKPRPATSSAGPLFNEP